MSTARDELCFIDHVQLAAPPGFTAEARAFFGTLLGLREIERPAAMQTREGLWFAVGPQQLHIGAEPEFRPARKAHPAFALVDADAARRLAQRLTDAGHQVTVADDVPGTCRFHTHDPWGNRLEFTAPRP